MPDGFEELLRDADGERPLPSALHHSLEEMLLAGTWRAIDLDDDATPDPAVVLAASDHPRALPAPTRARLERVLTERRRAAWAQRTVAVAATVVLLAAGGVALVRQGGSTAGRPPVAIPPDPVTTVAPVIEPTPADAAPDVSIVGLPSEPGAGVGAPGGLDPDDGSRGTAPPFAFSTFYAPAAPGAPLVGGGASGEPTPPPPPLAIAVVDGDPDQERGFRRYMNVLNEAGGIGGRAIRVFPAGPDAPPPDDVVATVNLSGRSLARGGKPTWIRGPLIEGLEATESQLAGSVFGFASPPERQATLAVDAVYPDDVTEPTTAVIYHREGGLFGEEIPTALTEALEERGVTVVRSAFFTDGRANLFVPGDVAFLSLGTSAAASWFEQTAEAGYEPFRGIAGIFSLMDHRLLPAMEGRNVSIIAPYARPENTEASWMSLGDPYAIGLTHGWVTAKNLAVAMWQDEVTTPGQMRSAIGRLAGYRSGFAPAYQVRPRTNARTPEGMLFIVSDGRFVARSGFERAP